MIGDVFGRYRYTHPKTCWWCYVVAETVDVSVLRFPKISHCPHVWKTRPSSSCYNFLYGYWSHWFHGANVAEYMVCGACNFSNNLLCLVLRQTQCADDTRSTDTPARHAFQEFPSRKSFRVVNHFDYRDRACCTHCIFFGYSPIGVIVLKEWDDGMRAVIVSFHPLRLP